MPRKARTYSKSNIYHIIQKGIDDQDIFYEDADKKYYLDILLEKKKEFKYKILAYCLMSNHIHLVLQIKNDNLSETMKSIGIKYAFFFNKKYSRSGSLFKDRFKSKCVEDKIYFLDVCRYVEQNPKKAGICDTENYKWNSYHEYVENNTIIDKDILMHYYDYDIEKYKFYTLKGKDRNFTDFIEYEIREKMTDDELYKIIMEKFNLDNINDFKNLSSEELKKGIKFLTNLKYTNYNQITRTIRMTRYQIDKYLKRGGKREKF